MRCNNEVILHLSLTGGIGPQLISQLLKVCNNDLHLLYEYTEGTLIQKGLTQRAAELVIKAVRDTDQFAKEQELIKEHCVNWCTFLDDSYPPLLKEIYAPPAILYWYGGELTSHKKSLAIVGSRMANRYTKDFIHQVAPSLVANGWVVVSGGARGADTMAHQETINAGGITVAVLGSGLLDPYPHSNKKLFKEIVTSGGTVVSPFPLRMAPQPGNFPARNRIIAGLSYGCIVTQAAAQSGARITAQYALEQGRDVFALPGAIDDPLSAGCHGLIQQGAKLVTCAKDILDEYHEKISVPATLTNKNLFEEQPACSAEERSIMQACKSPITFDELLGVTSLQMDTLQTMLWELQLGGRVHQDFAGRWVAQ